MIQIPRGAEREYLTILGVAAIYIAQVPIGPSFIGVSRDLHQSLVSLKRRFCGSEIVYAVWVRDPAKADRVRRAVVAERLDSPSVMELAIAVESSADVLHVPVTAHALVMQRVDAVVDHVTHGIEQAADSGELHIFNRAFRQYRLAMRQCGRVMTYREARARLRRAALIASSMGGEFRIAELLPTVFPNFEVEPDCSDIPEADAAWFSKAKLRLVRTAVRTGA